MSLETGTRIADLVPTNPVGATDFASQGDDHIRLIKACLQGSFPSLGATAVLASAEELNILDGATLSTAELNVLDGITASASELNILDGATLSTAELNILDGVTLTAAQINDAARKGANNSFSQPNTFGNVVTIGDSVVPDVNGSRSVGITGTRFGNVWTVNLNGVAVTDFARLSQANVFTAAQTVNAPANTNAMVVSSPNTSGQSFGLALVAGTVTGDYALYVANAGGGEIFRIRGTGGVTAGTPTGGDKGAGAINAESLYRQGVSVQSVPLINSTSTTLVKGQIHHIAGNATLPALGAGEWVCIVNNSGSDITITENPGDTTYWSTGHVSISTVTLQARGRMFASGAGSSVVYVTGDITGYT